VHVAEAVKVERRELRRLDVLPESFRESLGVNWLPVLAGEDEVMVDESEFSTAALAVAGLKVELRTLRES
jgi:hypothetical protein